MSNVLGLAEDEKKDGKENNGVTRENSNEKIKKNRLNLSMRSLLKNKTKNR
jgi:hypothetical protein